MVGNIKEKLFVLSILITTMIIMASDMSTVRDVEIHRILKKLNKPALKTIKSPDGDIIDCVHLKNHPIYDHPLFKNHTIQMRPSSYPKEWNNVYLNTENKSTMVTQLWTINGRCPKNSIPIRRTRRKDILRAETIERYGQKYMNNTPQPNRNSLPVTHEADNYRKTGCYNLICQGFVLVNQEFAIGARVRDVSTWDGRQYDIPTTIWKDSRSGNWWLKFSAHTLVGYWPSKLFSHLQNGATNIHWGGEIIDSHDDYPQHTDTNMGSGHFAQEGYKKASYFKNIEIINEAEIPQQPIGMYAGMTRKNCYNVYFDNHLVWGTYFFYGGPGRNPHCK